MVPYLRTEGDAKIGAKASGIPWPVIAACLSWKDRIDIA